MIERKSIGIGMLGAGWMGRAHNNGYKTAQYMYWPVSNWQIELVAIGGIDEAEGIEAANRFGYQIGVAGYQDIISNPKVTIFDNVTPDAVHVQPCIDAALAGKHVVCEKPLAVDKADAKRMLDAATKTGVKSIVGFSYRFFPAVRLAYELIKNGTFGKLYHFTGRYFQDSGHDESTPLEKTWYVHSGVSNGIASHLIDMARFLMGEIQEVNGMCKVYNTMRNSRNGPVNVTADEGFFAMIDFDKGTTGSFESLGVATGLRSQFEFEIFGSKGSLRWDVQEPNFLHVYLTEAANPKVLGYTKVCACEPNHPFMDVWWPAGHTLGWEHGHINMLAYFMDCVANDMPVAPLGATFEDGYKAAVVIDSIRLSSTEGRKMLVKYE